MKTNEALNNLAEITRKVWSMAWTKNQNTKLWRELFLYPSLREENVHWRWGRAEPSSQHSLLGAGRNRLSQILSGSKEKKRHLFILDLVGRQGFVWEDVLSQ